MAEDPFLKLTYRNLVSQIMGHHLGRDTEAISFLSEVLRKERSASARVIYQENLAQVIENYIPPIEQ